MRIRSAARRARRSSLEKYPDDIQLFTNSGGLGGYATFERVGNQHETSTTRLAAAGYQAAMMGKYLNGYDPGEGSADSGCRNGMWSVTAIRNTMI